MRLLKRRVSRESVSDLRYHWNWPRMDVFEVRRMIEFDHDVVYKHNGERSKLSRMAEMQKIPCSLNLPG